MNFLERFDAILFDLNGTLADDYDRFGCHQDYMPGYLEHGGECLAADDVRTKIESCLGRLIHRYAIPPADPFPVLRNFIETQGLPDSEIQALEGVIAQHEMGRIPVERARLLERLATTHRLGLVSDLWAPATCCRRYLDSAGLTGLFGSMVFSCEHGAVKPAPRLFMAALAELGVGPGEAVFVGDNAVRDVRGAANCGMATVWVNKQEQTMATTRPDRVVESVEELLDLI